MINEHDTTPEPGAGSHATTGSAFALITATALGSIIGARMHRLPLAIGVGAAAFALLRSRKTTSPQPPLPSASTESPPSQLENPVQAWLDRQSEADAATWPIPLAPPIQESAEAAADDDYVPLGLLPEDAPASLPDLPEAYAQLSEPVSLSSAVDPQTPATPTTQDHFTLPGAEPASPGMVTPALFGHEPVPSWSEELVEMEERGPPAPTDSASAENPALVFEGGCVPDHIDVIASASTSEPDPTPCTQEPAPQANAEPDAALPVIDVALASAGEACFDPPLQHFPSNPWAYIPTPPEFTPEPLDVVEAGVLFHPLSPVPNSVVPKAPSHTTLIPKSPPPAPLPDSAEPAAPSRPSVPPSDTAWRSWWKGD